MAFLLLFIGLGFGRRNSMDRDDMAKRYFAAWQQKDTSALLRLMHAQASYYDAFWCETCSGKDLAEYFSTSFSEETTWYEPDPQIVVTLNGMVVRYTAYEQSDSEGLEVLYNGAEVFTLSDDLILTVSDYYCDPNSVDLAEVASLAEAQHGQSYVVQRGLGRKSIARIKQKLAELGSDMTVFLDPSLTVTRMADVVGCTVMHLFHVLEVENDTTFLDFVNEYRARYASTLLIDLPDGEIQFDRIAKESGFDSVSDFKAAFASTFGLTADQYMERFAS